MGQQHFTEEQKKMARKADLYAYLIRVHGNDFIHDRNSIRLKSNHSINIKQGYSGYTDFGTDETGNSIDFLVRYMGYTVSEAVIALCGGISFGYTEPVSQDSPSEKMQSPVSEPEGKEPCFPKPTDAPYKATFAYLINRGIPSSVIKGLIDSKLLYQEKAHNNIVFINHEKDFAEVHGTFTCGEKSFHGVIRNARKDGFWWFRTSKDAGKAYVCEAAIDAISLYLIHQKQGYTEDAYYVSIAGVAKQDAINRIKGQIKTVIAVDNDNAGDKCRERNSDCESIIPILKDWNEDLLIP